MLKLLTCRGLLCTFLSERDRGDRDREHYPEGKLKAWFCICGGIINRSSTRSEPGSDQDGQ